LVMSGLGDVSPNRFATGARKMFIRASAAFQNLKSGQYTRFHRNKQGLLILHLQSKINEHEKNSNKEDSTCGL
jgi:hypothetical protein